MGRTLSITKRILAQLIHDPRTLLLLFGAPLLVIWLLSIILSADAQGPRIAVVGVPPELHAALEEQDARVVDADADVASDLLGDAEVSAVLSMKDGAVLDITVEGSDSGRTAAVMRVASQAIESLQREAIDEARALIERKGGEASEAQENVQRQLGDALAALPPQATDAIPENLRSWLLDEGEAPFPPVPVEEDIIGRLPVQSVAVSYLHGDESWGIADYYGPIFIVLFLFVFTFVTSTMSLVREREAGTLARFLTTPVAPVQIIAGYAIAFGLVGLVQSGIILAIALGPMGMPNEGNLEFVLVVAVSMAVVSVMMGLALSGLASTGFQVVQLMLVFVVPQILLCGLFDLSAAPLPLQILSKLLPLTYGVDALQAVMLRGAGRDIITPDLTAIGAFALLFLAIGVLAMRKKRARKEGAA